MKNSQYTGPPTSQPFRPQSMVGAETDSYTEAPGFQTKGNMTLVTDGQRTLPTGQTYIPAPTYTDMPHGVDTIGIGNDNFRLVTARDGVQQRPTLIDVVHRGNNTYTGSKGVVVNKNIVKDVGAPGFTDLPRRNATLAAGELTGSSTPTVDQYGGVVISVVGKKFREVNPTAYYIAKKNVI
ncbi:hypothetical protein HanRHA438_Chr09g0401131 [Helianthus annuus]|nr:hypothetical protein HanIR_Chr09g0420071 [Helianthus annuus]KAJ0888353.1 hypothetical protein HanRHA438_Chr09g0401131 [Helianthus annuus]